MPTTSNIERALGIVVGKLEGIEGQLRRQDESRSKLHQRVDDLVMRITHLENEMASIDNKVAREFYKHTQKIR